MMALLDTLHIPRNRSLIASNDSSDSANDLSLYFGLKSMAHNGLGHPVLLPVPRNMIRSCWFIGEESGCTAAEQVVVVVVVVVVAVAVMPNPAAAVTREVERSRSRGECCWNC